MAGAIIQNKDKLYAHFKRQETPFWKLSLYNDRRSIISSNLVEEDLENSLHIFQEICDSLDPSQMYALDMYEEARSAKGNAIPKSSISFCLSPVETVKEKKEKESGMFTGSDFKKSLEIVQENARLEIQLQNYKTQNQELIEKIGKLNNYISTLEKDIEELEDELEDYENEESSIGEVGKENLESVATSLLKTHGASIIEKFTGKKVELKHDEGVTGEEEEEELEDDPEGEYELEEEEPEDDKVTMNGLSNLPSMEKIILRLQAKDKKLHEHLYKLMLIAEQKPEMFKELISYLEGM